MTTERMLLRAELVHENRHIVAHTTQLTSHSVSVRTDERIALGATVQLRLSFPRLFEPLDLDAQVVSRETSNGPGYFAGVTLDFVGASPAHVRLVRLLEQQRSGREPAGVFRILVVEDSAVMRDCVQHSAERFSGVMRVETASADTAEQARELIACHYFDLALVDLFLPGALSGADLVRELRERGNDLPVIGVSVGGPAARDAFHAAGADLYLDKPVMLRDVFVTLERLVLAGRESL